MSATFFESTHGKRQLCYLGYRYSLKRTNKNGSEYWTCVKCQTTATSYSDLSVVVRDDHTHLPDETDQKVLEMRQNLKRKLIEESGPIDRIVEEAFHVINGRHSRIKKHVNAPHPNIYIAIDLLQKEQSLASIARLRDVMGAPTPKRRKHKVITDECLMKLWQRYDEGRIDIPAFLKAAGLRYFQRPSKR